MQYMELAQDIIKEVKGVVIGKDECIWKALAAILAGGHILIEDIPGVGKTTLAQIISNKLEAPFYTLSGSGYSLHQISFHQILSDFQCTRRRGTSLFIRRER